MKFKSYHLVILSLLILILPLLLFLSFWLRPLLALGFLSFLFYIIKDAFLFIKNNHQETINVTKKMLIISTFIILSWIVYGGIGKIGYQNFDYTKHNAIFYDLVNSKWPVKSTIDGSAFYLVYYLGYYLVPAAIGKMLNSFSILEWTTIIQSYLIILLILLLLSHISKISNLLLLTIAFILWGGADFLGNLLFYQEYSHQFGEFPEWWAGASNFQYTGFTDLLYWVPQHALGGWLSTILCFYFYQKKNYFLIPFISSFALFWSPFACFGLLPFLLLSLKLIPNWKNRVEWMGSRYGLWGLLILLTLLMYYATSDFKQPFQWQFNKMGPSTFTLRYIIFLLVEIGVPTFIVIYFKNLLTKDLYQLSLLTIILLVLIPHIYFGVYSDFAMRASIAGLFSLFIFSLIILKNIWKKTFVKYLVCSYLILISYSAISDFYRAQKLKNVVLGYGPTQYFAPKDISLQYFGRNDRHFFSLFFKR